MCESKIFAREMGSNKINGLGAAEIGCKDDPSPPFETSPAGYQAFDSNRYPRSRRLALPCPFSASHSPHPILRILFSTSYSPHPIQFEDMGKLY